MQVRVIVLADLDYFYAQCEEIRRPELKGKPVVIGMYSGRTEDSGAVSTANYVARSHGVKSGMPIVVAKRRLEGTDAVFLPVDHRFYEQVSERVMAILRKHADRFEQVSIDEAYLDVSQKTMGSFDRAEILSRRLKEEIRSQEDLTCSLGVGPNKLVAKIAADSQKPNGLTVVKPDEVASFLSPLPVSRLLGVGTKTREKMQTMKIVTIGDLARYDTQKLIETFGKKLGLYFHNAANGVDDEPVMERGEAESISRIVTLKEDTRELDAILHRTDGLCAEVFENSKQQGLSFRSISIMAVMNDMSVHSRSKTLDKPVSDLETLTGTVKELFERLLSESDLVVRRVGVKISGFVKEEKAQKQITDYWKNVQKTHQPSER